jgi:hypothetical protein
MPFAINAADNYKRRSSKSLINFHARVKTASVLGIHTIS